MRFNILGPLEVVTEDGPLTIGGERLRGFLAALLVRTGQPVPVERLIDGLWGESPPTSALANVRTYAYQARRILDGSEAVLTTYPAAYQLTLRPQSLDLYEYRRHAEAGTGALRRDEYEHAADLLGTALRLWRGRALEGMELQSWVRARAIALDDHYQVSLFGWVEASLALGRHESLLPTLRELVTEYPLSERAWYLLIEALHHSGRTGDALSAYHQVRALLADELGLAPGPDLERAHVSILRRVPWIANSKAHV